MASDVHRQLVFTIEGESGDGVPMSFRHTDIETLAKLVSFLHDLVGENAGIALENGSLKATIDASASTVDELVKDCELYERGDTRDINPKRLAVFKKMARQTKDGHRRYTLGYRGKKLLQFSKGKYEKNERHRTEDAELEIEGEVVGAGGKGNTCIRMQNVYGSYTISVPREVLTSLRNNILYRNILVSVKCKYDVVTKEFRNYEFVRFVEPATYNEKVMKEVVRRGTVDWKNVQDPCKWVAELRGKEE